MGAAFSLQHFESLTFKLTFVRSSCLFFLVSTARRAHKHYAHTHAYKHISQLICSAEQVTSVVLGVTHNILCKSGLQPVLTQWKVGFSAWANSHYRGRYHSLVFLFNKTQHTGYELGLMQSRAMIRSAYFSCQKVGDQTETLYVWKSRQI